jgi:hypothetical protein
VLSTVLGRRGWRRALLPPLAAFVLANALFAVVAAYGGDNPLRAATWESFDSPIYAEIAQYGYLVRDCSAPEAAQGAKTCGNVGWFPVYPWLMHAGTWLGMSPDTAGIVASLALWLVLLVVLWNGLLLAGDGAALLPALALATFAPGAFYFHTVYPVALAACLLTIAVVCLRRRWWLGAGAAGFLATASYPASAPLAGVALLWLAFIEPAPGWWERLRRIALVSGLTGLGFVAVLAFQWVDVGQWDGYFGVQARFHHGIHLPFHNYLDLIKPRFEGLGHVSVFLSLQALLTTAIVLAIVVSTWLRWRRGQTGSFDWLLVLWALTFWIVPLGQNVVAYYRTDALIVPAIAAFTWVPARLGWLYALAGAAVASGMLLAFGQGVLV